MGRKKRNNLGRTIRGVYREVIADRYKDQNFWVLSAFIPTFIGARLIVNFYPSFFVPVKGEHIHHFAYGFVILALTGYISVVRPRRSPPWLAFLFGVGLALALDEAGMWWHLTNHYYNDTSEDVIIVTSAILINLVYFRHFWIRVIKEIIYWLRFA
jgi:hypothetical protein